MTVAIVNALLPRLDNVTPKDEEDKLELDKILELLAEQKAQAAAASAPIKTFAEDKELVIKNGRYGAYIAYKGKNYRLPAGKKPEALTFEECMAIVSAPKKSKR